MKPGFQVGQFVMERPLGEGGMAEVWLARHVHLGTPAAIKFLNQQFSTRADIEARFLNEGKRQGALDHPNIVKVFGFDYVGAQSFLILQYIEGEALDMRLGRGLLSREETLRISTGVLNALAFAHAAGVVHRDVKPSNILLDRSSHPYLGDFGIVLAVNEKRLTMAGTSMGTPHYMSPEQISRPAEVDLRADIYSFGCVLYEMLTGKVPFDAATTEGTTDFNVKLAHLQTPPPPPRNFNPSIPVPVEAVVLRCLAKEPGQRFSTCVELRDALVRAMSATVVEPVPVPIPTPGPIPVPKPVPPPAPIPGPVPPPPLPPKPVNKLWLGLGAAALAVAAGLGWALSGSKAPEIESFTATPETVQAGQPVVLSWSVKNAEKVFLPSIGSEPSVGSTTIRPTQTGSYTLQATNKDKDVSRVVSITVIPPPPPPHKEPDPKPIAIGDVSQVDIRQFELSPSIALANQPVTLRWDVRGATGVTIGDTKEPLRGEATVHSDTTVNYTLHAHEANGSIVNKTITLTVLPRVVVPPPGPEITSLTISPETVRAGQTVEVRWAVKGAQKVMLGTGQVDAVGSKTFTIDRTSTATITAEGADGKQVTKSVKAIVIGPQQPATPALRVTQFTAQPSFVAQPGQAVLLTYAYTGAVRATIEPEAGPLLTTTGTGRVTVVFPRATTRYVLTAYGPNGETARSEVMVVVPNGPDVDTRPQPVVSGLTSWPVRHMHSAAKLSTTNNGSYGNLAVACDGVLSVANGALHFRSITSNDSFDVPFSDVEEVRENKLPLGGMRAFHVKLRNRNYNFVPQQSVQAIVDSINRAMGR